MTRIRQAAIFTVTTLIGILSACSGGDGTGLEMDTMPPDPGPPMALFSEIQANVLTPTCATSGCHSGAGAPQGLRLDEVNSYGLLVNQASNQDPSLLRVEPLNPNGSYLVRKLDGSASVGARMPLGGPPLDGATLASIRQWIAEGAVDDRAASSTTFSVTATAPLPGEQLGSMPVEVIAMFDRAVDPSTVNALTFTIEGSGGDGSFTDGNEYSLLAKAIEVSPATPRRAKFKIDAQNVHSDHFRIRIRGAGASGVLDMDANALPGDYESTFIVLGETAE